MDESTPRERLEAYAKEKYKAEPEQLPFSKEDYAVLRHSDTGKWFAVFIAKPRSEFGLSGNGMAEIVSLKIRDPLLTDMLLKQPGFLSGYPSGRWNWVSIVLDGSVPDDDIVRWLDESFAATDAKGNNKKVTLLKRNNIKRLRVAREAEDFN